MQRDKEYEAELHQILGAPFANSSVPPKGLMAQVVYDWSVYGKYSLDGLTLIKKEFLARIKSTLDEVYLSYMFLRKKNEGLAADFNQLQEKYRELSNQNQILTLKEQMVKTENENLRLQLENKSMCKMVGVIEDRREVIAERIDPEPLQQLWTKSRMERE